MAKPFPPGGRPAVLQPQAWELQSGTLGLNHEEDITAFVLHSCFYFALWSAWALRGEE